MPCKQKRLNVWNKPDRDDLLQERMLNFLLLTPLPLRDNLTPRGITHHDTAPIFLREGGRINLAPIDECENKAVSQVRSQLFHHVKREAGTAGPIRVQKSDSRIKAD